MIVCGSKLQSHLAMLDKTTRLPNMPVHSDICEQESTCSQPHCKAAHIHRSMFADLLHSCCPLEDGLIYLWICLYTLAMRNLDNMFACLHVACLHVVTCAILLTVAMLACKVAGRYFCRAACMCKVLQAKNVKSKHLWGHQFDLAPYACCLD